MKFWLTLLSGEERNDLLLEVDEGATVGHVAHALAQWHVRGHLDGHLDGRGSGEGEKPTDSLTCVVEGKTLDSSQQFASSKILHGQQISVAVAPPGHSRELPAGPMLVVVEGPDRGKRFPLKPGVNEVGRNDALPVSLSDPAVGWQHARVLVAESVSVVDSGSRNGTYFDGQPIAKEQILGMNSRIGIGKTILELQGSSPGSEAIGGGTVPFNRPPTFVPTYVPRKFKIPTPPFEAASARFSLVPAILPLLMGATMFAVTRNPLSGLFILFSPLMVVGTYFENKRNNRKKFEGDAAQFRGDLQKLRTEIAIEQAGEAEELRRAYPHNATVLEAASSRNSLLWSRGPDNDDFGVVRFGLGERKTRVTFDVPDGGARQLRPDVVSVPDHFAVLGEVPITAPLLAGGLGVSGQSSGVRGATRSVLLQLAILHSPSELVICGLLASENKGYWEWMKWMPHTRSSMSPLDVNHLASAPQAVDSLLRSLRALIDDRSGGPSASKRYQIGPDTRCAIVVLIDEKVRADRVLLAEVMEQGPAVGITFIWIGSTLSDLPRTCANVLDVGDGVAVLGNVKEGTTHPNIRTELIDSQTAFQITTALAPLQDESRRTTSDLGLPNSVGLVDLLGGPEILQNVSTITKRWAESKSVAAPLGVAPGSTFTLDLRLAGPHGFVVGTTGSGKSELLRSLLVGLGASVPPNRLNFLLIDFKGGAGLRPFATLPHTVGLVTNLQDGSADADAVLEARVQRTLTWLRAELQRRFRIFEELGVSDLVDLERAGNPAAPPRLLIVADEFAVLSSKASASGSDVIDDMVNVARLGRSLGIHLLLATQRASGVITDNIRANTNLKIALRVQDNADSKEVIGNNRAAQISQKSPGRAFVAIGGNEPVELQTASSQGFSLEGPGFPRVSIENFTIDDSDELSEPWSNLAGRAKPNGPGDLEALVNAIGAAADAVGQRGRFIPWVDALAPAISLAAVQLSDAAAGRVAIGHGDQPNIQKRTIFELDLARDGSALFFGASGSGKSSALLTVAASIAQSATPAQVEIHAIDAGTRGLTPLRVLPHVGTVIVGEDQERFARLLTNLRARIADRTALLERAGVVNLEELKSRVVTSEVGVEVGVGVGDLARVVVLIDGLGGLVEMYKESDPALLDQLARIAADGRQLGIHVVASADRRGTITSSIAAAFAHRIVLRMATNDEYLNIGISPRDVPIAPPPGRALVGDVLVQIAMPMTKQLARRVQEAAEADDEAQLVRLSQEAGRGEQLSAAFLELAEGLPEASRAIKVEPIGVLPDDISVEEVAAMRSTLPGASAASGVVSVWDKPFFGLTERGLVPVAMDISQFSMLVAGPPGSGKSNALATIGSGVAAGGCDVLFASIRPGSVVPHGPWQTLIGDEDIGAALDTVIAELGSSGGTRSRPLLILVDDTPEMLDKSIDTKLLELVKAGRRGSPIRLVVAGDNADLRKSSSGQAIVEMRRYKQALLLQADLGNDGMLLDVQLPRRTRYVFGPGRGLLVRRSNIEIVQVAKYSS